MKGRCARQASIYCLCCSCMCCICYRRACYCTVSCYKLSLPWADGVKGCCARQASIYCLCCNCMCCICCRRACYCTVSCYKLSLPWADGVKGCCARQASIYCLCCSCMCCICWRRACCCTANCCMLCCICLLPPLPLSCCCSNWDCCRTFSCSCSFSCRSNCSWAFCCWKRDKMYTVDFKTAILSLNNWPYLYSSKFVSSNALANSVRPDQTAQEQPDLDLHCVLWTTLLNI